MLRLAFVFKGSIFDLMAIKLNFTLTPNMFSSMQPSGGCLVFSIIFLTF
jgi:hypothetical protein